MSKYLRIEVNQNIFGKLPSQIKYKTQIGVCVQQAFKYRGYTRVDNNQQKWDIFWTEKQNINSIHQNQRIMPGQILNHFRTYYELCRKDNLNRNLKKHKKNLQKQGRFFQAKQLNFFPLTYHLPIQYSLFAQQFKRCSSDKQNIWIMKPVSKSQGKGIFLINKLSSISQWSGQQSQPYIIQRYINNPLLVGGKKFDMRIYVLATSYKPLTIYLYRQGFARFTTQRYNSQDIQNSEIHLTNVAIQKNSSQYNKDNGGKWQLNTLKLFFLSKYSHLLVQQGFSQIQKLIIKTLKSVSKIMSVQKNCFQLYGFDIMFDQNFKPWLIQINGSPSMRANTKEDKKMKIGIIDDVLTIADLEQILTGKQTRIGGFDMICDQDNEKKPFDKYLDATGSTNCFLGCVNNRKRIYFELAHQINKKGNQQNNLNRANIINCQSPKKKAFSVRKQPIFNNRLSSINDKRQNPENNIKQTSSTQINTKINYDQISISKSNNISINSSNPSINYSSPIHVKQPIVLNFNRQTTKNGQFFI